MAHDPSLLGFHTKTSRKVCPNRCKNPAAWPVKLLLLVPAKMPMAIPMKIYKKFHVFLKSTGGKKNSQKTPCYFGYVANYHVLASWYAAFPSNDGGSKKRYFVPKTIHLKDLKLGWSLFKTPQFWKENIDIRHQKPQRKSKGPWLSGQRVITPALAAQGQKVLTNRTKRKRESDSL